MGGGGGGEGRVGVGVGVLTPSMASSFNPAWFQLQTHTKT